MVNMREPKTIGDTLRTARLSAGLTQHEVGIACGCNEKYAQSIVARWENGNRPVPKNKMVTVSKLLNIPVENLL